MVKTKTKQHWISALEAAGVPCGPINNLDEVFENPQVQARNMRVDLPHPTGATVKLVGSPMKMSATPSAYDMPPPLLGQHTDDVLRDLLGKGDDEIAALKERGIV